MILTYEKIREVKLNEKGEKLQELPPNFFENAFRYINLKKGAVEEESAKSLVFRIFQLRMRKISNLAYYYYKSDKLPENLERNEEKLYLDLVNGLRNHSDRFNRNFEEAMRKKVETSENQEENAEAQKKDKPKEQNIKRVKFVQEVPEIFLPSQGTCCFKKGEEKKLEEEEANLLLNKGFCETLKD